MSTTMLLNRVEFRDAGCPEKCKGTLGVGGNREARGRAEPKLWAEWRNRGMALATKSGIWA